MWIKVRSARRASLAWGKLSRTELGLLSLAPWMFGLSLMIAVIGGLWIVMGASLRRGLAGTIPSRVGYRASALALTLLAGSLSAHAFGVI